MSGSSKEKEKQQPTIKLDMTCLSSFKPSKFFPSNALNKSASKANITSLDFDDSGEFLVSASQDETVQLYDCKRGKHVKTLFGKKYGVHLAKFTHKNTNIVHASTKENDVVRLLSLHDNSFLRYFQGHTKKVVSLEVSPADDTILTGSQDNTVRLWDLKSPNCQGLLHIPSPVLAVFDPTGQIFCVTSHQTGSIMLYDLRNFDKEPFSTWRLTDDAFLQKFTYPPRMPQWTKVEFSNDGKYVLIATDGEAHYVLDAFTGDLRFRLTGHEPLNCLHQTSGDTCFTPDGRHVISGSGDKSLAFWDMTGQSRSDRTLTPAAITPAAALDKPNCIAFNPRTAMLATADTELFMWLPDLPDA